MDFENKYIDELIEDRRIARENKDWKLSDEIRNFLDSKLVFIFDVKGNDKSPFQETHYLFASYFSRMERIEGLYGVKFKSQRSFLEWSMKRDIANENILDAWIYSQLSSSKALT